MSAQESDLLSFYYSGPYALFTVCLLNEGFLAGLFLLAHKERVLHDTCVAVCVGELRASCSTRAGPHSVQSPAPAAAALHAGPISCLGLIFSLHTPCTLRTC